MAIRSSTLLSLRLSLASLASVVAVLVVCVVGLVSLRDVSRLSRSTARQQVELFDDSDAFEALLAQRSLVDEYLLGHQKERLRALSQRSDVFQKWTVRASAAAADDQSRRLLRQVIDEYARFDHQRSGSLALFDAGHEDEARSTINNEQASFDRLLLLVERVRARARQHAGRVLVGAEAATLRLSRLLVGTSILGILASLAVGFFWARRFARPIAELQLGVESAAQRVKIQLIPGGDLDSMADQVAAMVRRLEELDASLAEQRRRAIQSEKLSAVGEVAAKLAHEILNPLAGMKTAVQLLARGGKPRSDEAIHNTSQALSQEIERVEGLLRRLMNYARPLAPRVEVCPVAKLLDAGLEAAGPELRRCDAEVQRQEEPELPPIEVDVQLMTQVLANLVRNAAQAMGTGGVVELRAFRHHAAPGEATRPASRTTAIHREQLCIEVSDHGPGISAQDLPKLFHPFFTTKAGGHGLGLAVSQNIVLEHGGEIVARNREGGGAVFLVCVPLLR
jgi:signal transduction histidine kinase